MSLENFVMFMDKKDVLLLSVSYVIGAAANDFMTAFVNDVIVNRVFPKPKCEKNEPIQRKMLRLFLVLLISLVIGYIVVTTSEKVFKFT